RAVQVGGRQRTVRAPRLTEPADLAFARHALEAVGALYRLPDTEVARREHVGPAEMAEQEHVRCPGPDAAHRRELRPDLVVAQIVEAVQLQAAIQRARGEIAE